jgi:P-type E1-E2 ATPase
MEIVHICLIWLVVYNYLIPISLFVTIELQRFPASQFFRWDRGLYDEERNLPARCNTSDINEELGLVTHLFTDKTGTLTRNVMVFREYTRCGALLKVEQLAGEAWSEFIMVMTLCHSVQVSS